ncbi:hypothetical protein BBL07_10475 [Agrobacterium vitis]|nr:hypothetical protein BBL07_10475 [Agrobacterium vitis]
MNLLCLPIVLWHLSASLTFADSAELRGTIAAESQAFWASATFWVTVASLLASVAALIGLFFSLRLTRQTLAVTRELGHRQTRAYVEAAGLELSIDKGDLVVICRNSGETPAPFFAVGVEARRVPKSEMYRLLCVKLRVDPSKSWTALGKGSDWRAKVTPPTGSQAVREFGEGSFNPEERLLITGIIIYKDIFGHYFRTEFAFFTHNEADKNFMRPNGQFPAYVEVSNLEASKILGMST